MTALKLSLDQLSTQSGVPGRTIRYYIQKGLITGPAGEKRGAWYSQGHLSDLLRIRQWQETGLSLEAIAGLLQARHDPPVPPRRPGAIEVHSHLVVTDGIELVVSPERSGLTQAQIRRLFQNVLAALDDIKNSPKD
jgi:DNA-binding transcriptional MerR regulator